MDTHLSIQLGGKSINLKLSRAASEALQLREAPLHVEMELYFSCMIRKKVRFYEKAMDTEYVAVNSRLNLGFRPVMTQQCSIHETDGPPPVTDFPIANASSFIPHWINIDFHNGEWRGEFGFN